MPTKSLRCLFLRQVLYRCRMTNLLLADIGGTYGSFAIARNGVVGPTVTIEVAAHHGAIEAIRDVLAREPERVPLDGALLSAAGTVQGGRCTLTNAAWILDEVEIARAFGWRWMRL